MFDHLVTDVTLGRGFIGIRRSDAGGYVGGPEVVALEQQRRVHAARERIGGAVGEIKPGLRMDAFAMASERGQRSTRLRFLEGEDLEIILDLKEAPQPLFGVRAAPRAEDNTGFVDVHGRNQQAIGVWIAFA
jgi:hypothetical protein